MELVAKTKDVVRSDTGITIQPSKTFADCADPVDILFVGGGSDGAVALMTDRETRGKTAKLVTSVCTGSMVLGAPAFIKRMSLTLLSQEASFLYVTDFRTGTNIFGRGFLMAAEMDDRVQAKTGGKKSLRDAFRALLAWSANNQRALQIEEITQIVSESTGVDVRDIVAHWMEAPLQ